MELIDDSGRVFGRVNVIDALVVLIIIAVVSAGIVFVFTDDSAAPETKTTYATLDMGVQEPYLVEEISAGDTYEPSETSTLRVTDVHLTPHEDGTRVFLRVAIKGELNEQGSIIYQGAPPRLGRSLSLITDRYEISGRIRDVGESDAITTAQQTVVLSTRMAATDARTVTPGDEVRVGGRVVARIENVTTYTTKDPNQRQLFVAVTVDAHRQQNNLRFGGQPLRRGQSLTLPTGEYVLNGHIEQVGGKFDLGETTTRNVTLQVGEIRKDFASVIEEGMVERTGDTTVARITEVVEVEPSLIIVTGSEEASVAVVDHPVKRDVTLRTELQLRETPSGLAFKGEQIRQGSEVVLNLGTITLEATVIAVEE
ncbi:DUF4330 family protein [Haloplanus halophilus]|uniref:DUF4330 family protein n=1 Tax=Haloplanus halophilus TaxID=2949993 RepID=UPI002041710A|nr:DUF4330 family protein [Haloplanus sp. GDY1]